MTFKTIPAREGIRGMVRYDRDSVSDWYSYSDCADSEGHLEAAREEAGTNSGT